MPITDHRPGQSAQGPPSAGTIRKHQHTSHRTDKIMTYPTHLDAADQVHIRVAAGEEQEFSAATLEPSSARKTAQHVACASLLCLSVGMP